MTKKRTIVTAALPYVNNVPHLGNIIPTLSADVYHRFLKLAGHEKIYICGTDEHGTRTEIEAAQRNMSPDDYCRELHAKIQELYNWLGIEFDTTFRKVDHHSGCRGFHFVPTPNAQIMPVVT